MTAVSFQVLFAIAGTVALFWALPQRWPQLRWLALAVAGLVFLAILAPYSAGLLAAFIATSFALVRSRLPAAFRYLHAVAAFALLLVLRPTTGGAIAWFGAAFYILRVIHVTVESARGALPPRMSFLDYAAYMAFPPTLPVGPVERFPWFQREKQRLRWSAPYFAAGLETMLYGYVQIMFIADFVVDQLFWSQASLVENDVLRDWLECLRYGASLYFRFAGYSDVAIGFALLLGIRVRENFRRPYLARNIVDFWRRWNISVTSWCRDYVNLPELALTRNRSLAALASMMILGLWHEVSWRYLLWGVFNGIGIAGWRGWRSLRETVSLPESRVEAVAAWALTMVFIVAGFAITRENTLSDSLQALALLVGWEVS